MKSRDILKIGGQAVIEGVMIKSQNYYAVSVRKKGKIISKTEKLKSRSSEFLKKPVIRGFFNLVDMLSIGMKSLMWSAEQAGDEDEKITKKEMAFTIAFSMAAVIVIFIGIPYFLTGWIGFREESSPFYFNLIDGMIRILFFVLYIAAISFMSDVKTLFRYHGAEHMAVHCHEKGLELNAKNVRKFPTMHPRCGTSFIFLVLIVSILAFSVIPSIVNYLFPEFAGLNLLPRKAVLFLVRVSFVPLIAGVSYEILKASDRFHDRLFFRMIALPGILLQKITTKSPTDAQIEVAINSVKSIIRLENKNKK
ncbi:DUF1385 domain-containing protein [Candidatus Woesearchaeota archaeon]|nr:DUF1385 domain-containing protein [Candidatus Woesearchaeota archaeon]